MSVTLILPVKNRCSLLQRVLRYYAAVEFPYPILVGNGSDGTEAEAVRRLLDSYTGHLRLSVWDQSCDMISSYLELLERVETAYVLLAGDDDFFVPRGVERCWRYLTAHPDYNAACGDVLSIYTHMAADGSLHLDHSFPDGYRSVTDELPSRRLVHFSTPHTMNTTYCVQRTEPLRTMLRRCVALRLYQPQNAFSETALNAQTLLHGKLRRLPGLYHVRLRHRPAAVTRQSVEHLDYGLYVYNEASKPGWAEKLRLFVDVVAEELLRHEPLDRRTAHHVAETMFLGWFLPRATRNRDRLVTQLRPLASRRPAHTLLKRMPGVSTTWTFLQALRPGRLSVDTALKPASPYYEDFLPVYRSLMSAPSAARIS